VADGDCGKIWAENPAAAQRERDKSESCNRITTIPKGLRPSAQGCEARATLGYDLETNLTAMRLWQIP
jgi:hypothetical protein